MANCVAECKRQFAPVLFIAEPLCVIKTNRNLNQTFKYRPPLKYPILGIPLILISALFFSMIGKEDLWISIIFGFLALLFLAVGFGFTAIFVNKFNVGGLVIGNDFIEIPGRWKERTKLSFEDIKNIGEFETYDHIIEIESEKGVHLIERNWMKRKEFNVVRNKLKEYWTKNE